MHYNINIYSICKLSINHIIFIHILIQLLFPTDKPPCLYMVLLMVVYTKVLFVVYTKDYKFLISTACNENKEMACL